MYMMTSAKGGAFKFDTDFDDFLRDEKKKKKIRRLIKRKKYLGF